MDLSAPTLWWLAAGLLVAGEMASGTFYLLMLALGCVGGALLAHGGADATWQLAVAALVGGGATAAWHYKRARAPRSAPAAENRDVLLDIGQTVQVDAWAADGSASVVYRGARWEADHAGDAKPAAGRHVIVAVHGNRLTLARAEPAAPAAASAGR